MRVLLLGDYSGVHYNLYRGLVENDVDVKLISSGDGYKKIPTQIAWNTENSKKLSRVLGIHGVKFMDLNNSILSSLVDYDVVQVINPNIIEGASINDNYKIFCDLKKNNKKIFLYSCGDDLNWVSSCMFGAKNKYWFNELSFYLSKEVFHPLRYILNPYLRKLCNKVYADVDGIIPGSMDYSWCLGAYNNKKEMIPFPIDIAGIEFKPVRRKYVYNILHGKQPGKEIRKGDAYFIKSVERLAQRLNYKSIGGVPYSKYIELIRDGDIFFDQIHSCDQGVNALLAMACGKVVYSGFSDEFLKYYNIRENSIGINASDDVLEIECSLENILSNKIDVEEISFGARNFVVENHDHKMIARKFMKVWSDNGLVV